MSIACYKRRLTLICRLVQTEVYSGKLQLLLDGMPVIRVVSILIRQTVLLKRDHDMTSTSDAADHSCSLME